MSSQPPTSQASASQAPASRSSSRRRLPRSQMFACSAGFWGTGLGLPAWILSLLVHSLLFTTFIYLYKPAPRTVLVEADRTTGIVLKSVTSTGELYEEFEELQAAPQDTRSNAQPEQLNASETEAIAQAVSTLPTAPRVTLDNSLPELPTIGPLLANKLGKNSASQMTSGASKRAAIPTGGKTTVSIFGLAGKGRSFAYVFDHSSSMDGAPLRAAKKQLTQSLKSLDSIHRFQIIFFNHHYNTFQPPTGHGGSPFATSENIQLARRFVNNISASGGTSRTEAMLTALRYHPDVIFFLTDADDPIPQDELEKIRKKNLRTAAQIHCIEFGIGPSRKTRNFLVQLAEITEGKYIYVNTEKL